MEASPIPAARIVLLFPALREFVTSAIPWAETTSPERREVLDKAVAFALDGRSHVHLNFICTHNSRRSHLSHVWAHVAAFCYELNVKCYSGGTEATACNERTVATFERAGFGLLPVTNSGGEAPVDPSNPVYEVSFAEATPPIRVYSKVYSDLPNPQSDFAAMMCCSDVDDRCPVVRGAAARIPLHYLDPKAADDMPNESDVYDARCREIAAEMFYLMSSIKTSS